MDDASTWLAAVNSVLQFGKRRLDVGASSCLVVAMRRYLRERLNSSVTCLGHHALEIADRDQCENLSPTLRGKAWQLVSAVVSDFQPLGAHIPYRRCPEYVGV